MDTDRPWFDHYAPGVPREVGVPDVPLTRLLADTVGRFPGRPAIRFYGATLSYGAFDERTARCAAALAGLGVRKGDRVAVMLPNVPQFPIAFYGALRAGAVVVQTNPLYQSEELLAQLLDSGTKVLFALDIFRERIEPIMTDAGLDAVIYCGVRDYLKGVKRLLYPVKAKRDGMWRPFEKHPPAHDMERLLAAAAITPPAVRPAADDVALLQYTGGTTGVPKGVILTHRNLVANTLQCRAWIPQIREGEARFLSVIPFFHVYGMTTCMNLSVMAGGEMILLPKFSTLEVLKTIQRTRPNLFPGIQAMYLAISNHPKAHRYNLRSIEACVSGAGPLQADVQERFEALTGAQVVEGYGLSEAAPVTHANPIGGTRKVGSIGLPFPGTDARVVAEDGETELPVDEVGELVIRGPQVMKGYWNRSEETLATLAGGWLHTGDMARMDQDGFFYIADRKKDMIKTGGENVYPREVEEVLFRHPKVHEAVVAGLPDDFLGEKIRAYLVLNEGEAASAEEIQAWCGEHLARFKIPKEVEFRAELPKNIVGKVLRRMLREEERQKAAAGVTPDEAPTAPGPRTG
jgi:long-chain acyl-CoA synthetase